MTAYKVKLQCCDDHTDIEVELTGEQYTFLTWLADRLNTASVFDCQPRMYVERKFVGVHVSGGGA